MFENIWLSFYPDAKIGVVGVNGSGKSTLLKIIAGLDKEFTGEAKALAGTRMGYLEQEPHLDPALDVWGNVVAWCEEKKTFDKFNAVAAKLGEDYTDELMEEMTTLQEKIDAGDLWDIDSKIEMAMDALRCPPDDSPVGQALRRRAAPRRAGPSAAVEAGHAVAGRADQPPRRRVGRLATAPPGELSWLRDPRHPRPLLPRPGHQVDAGTRSRQGRALRGQLFRLAGTEGKARPPGAVRERGPPARHGPRELEWVRSSAKARQAKSKARLAAYDEMVNQQEREKQSFATIQIPPGPRLGQRSHRGCRPGKGIWRQGPVQGA